MTKPRKKRPIPYQYRQRHRLLAIAMCLPLLVVATTGCLLALKEPMNHFGLSTSDQLWAVLYDLHRSLLAGWPGRIFVSMIALGLWLMLASGFKSRVNIKGRKLSLHAALGIGLGIPITIIASIGSLLNFVEPLSQWLDPIPVVTTTAETQVVLPPTTEAELSAAKQAAQALHDDETLVKIYQPKLGRPYLIFYYQDHTRIYIDPRTATVLKVRTAWSHWTSSLLPLHGLRPLGGLGSGLLLILGVALSWLSARGLTAVVRVC